MAVLLAWINWDAAPIDARLWAKLVRTARAQAPGEAMEACGLGYALFALHTHAQAPRPLQHDSSGRPVLVDAQDLLPLDEYLQEVADAPAAVIAPDRENRQCRLLRDRLGQRPLVWARLAGGLLVASNEHVLLAHPEISREPDAEYLACYFGAIAPAHERSAYAAIHSVPAATELRIDALREHCRRLPSTPLDCRGWSDQRVQQSLREHLSAAVNHDARNTRRLALSLSGGLDSTSVAALLPPQLPPPLAISYGCDHDANLDERPLARELAAHLGMDWSGFAIDRLGPLDPAGERPVCLDTPIASPYREIKSALYTQLAQRGFDVVLTGNFGDHLNANAEDWLIDAWTARRWGVIGSVYAQLFAQHGWRGLWRDRGWRSCLSAPAPMHCAPWLTSAASAPVLATQSLALQQAEHWPRPRQAAHALGSYAAFDAAGECFFAQQFGIEVRHPYRYWPLVQLCLSLPAFYSWRGTQGKWAIRQALHGRLPDRWRLRPKSTSMHPLFARSLSGRGLALARTLVNEHRESWSRFVQPTLADEALRVGPVGDRDDLLLWLLIGFALWRRATQSSSAAG